MKTETPWDQAIYVVRGHDRISLPRTMLTQHHDPVSHHYLCSSRTTMTNRHAGAIDAMSPLAHSPMYRLGFKCPSLQGDVHHADISKIFAPIKACLCKLERKGSMRWRANVRQMFVGGANQDSGIPACRMLYEHGEGKGSCKVTVLVVSFASTHSLPA